MDIDLLAKMVKELILDNDRVVLPGFGCFVAEIVPASFSDKGYTVNPPYRRLYFRAKPDEGNLLVDFYVNSNDVEYELAEKIIGDFLTELKSVIYSKKVVVFPGLGRLRATKENNLFFVADEDLDIYPAGFGLEPISLKTHQESRAEVKAVVEGLRNMLVEESVQGEEPVNAEVPVRDDVVESVVEATPIFEPVEDSEGALAEDSVDESVATPEGDHVEEPEVEPIEDTAAEAESVPVPAPDPSPSPVPALEPVSEVEKSSNKVLKCVGVILVVAVALVAAYVAVGRLCPEWIDQFLYSPEELEILNR